jgi:hypothetical protein
VGGGEEKKKLQFVTNWDQRFKRSATDLYT